MEGSPALHPRCSGVKVESTDGAHGSAEARNVSLLLCLSEISP